MSNEKNETNNAEIAKAADAAKVFHTALAAMMEVYKGGGDEAVRMVNDALTKAVAGEKSPTGGNDESGYRRYELGEAIKIFIKAMGPYADRMTDEMKQHLANLGTGMFAGLRETKREYSSDVIPYLKENSEGFTPDMMEALDEFSLAHDIEYCKGAMTFDSYALTHEEVKSIVKAFRAAAEGRFYRPTWCPDYIDTIDKMKAFVFAYMTDINYHYEREILEEKGVEAFAQIADLWLGDVDRLMAKEKELIGR